MRHSRRSALCALVLLLNPYRQKLKIKRRVRGIYTERERGVVPLFNGSTYIYISMHRGYVNRGGGGGVTAYGNCVHHTHGLAELGMPIGPRAARRAAQHRRPTLCTTTSRASFAIKCICQRDATEMLGTRIT